MTVKEWLARPIKMRAIGVQELRPRLYCYDGYSISVQASEYHYCSPRLNGLQDYQSVELGFPSKEDELINEYAEDNPGCLNTVYGYVPIKIVEKHGGIRT